VQASTAPAPRVVSGFPALAARLSIIVPAYNNGRDLAECLAAIKRSARCDDEIIVVDDASTQDLSAVAAALNVRFLRLARNSGPGAARNHGARLASGRILFFVDADVVLAPDAVDRVAHAFEADGEVAAIFGSYDARPRAQGVISRYRNLLHHFVHQQGKADASTFWAGCGAIRREIFEALGGFDHERFPQSSIEDIDLGVRVRQEGHRIVLDKELQGTHLKRWGLRAVIWTDVTRRAMPWARLILETGRMPDDLNVSRGQRLSVGLVALASLVAPLAVIQPWLLALSGSMVATIVLVNRKLFVFFFRQGGARFALACLPLHLIHFFCSGLSFLLVWPSMPFRSAGTRVRVVTGDIR
jgi:cellulose synthase/poly-beta-1,6-N-acetylglucosamine synthase-like glycosyltransferase